MMTSTRILVSLLLVLGLVGAPAHAGAPGTPERDSLDLIRALGELRSGPSLAIHREAGRLIIYDPYQSEVLLVIDPMGLETAGPESGVRPAPGAPAVTRVVHDPAGAVVYSHSVTWRGARITVLAPGQVNDTGLHVVAFDDDDVTISDGLGRLMFQRHTAKNGALTERQGVVYGCGCERITSPEGRVVLRDL